MAITDGDKIAAAILVAGNVHLDKRSLDLVKGKYRMALELIATLRMNTEDGEGSVPSTRRSGSDT